MKVNLKEFRNRSEYIDEQSHPALPLLIWNYNHKCQFAKKWDKYTMMCRGLITDLDGNIVARPFKKFFNYGEDASLRLPIDMPIITEKLDGSLGIQYYDGDKVCISTRGSFMSEQAQWATKWMENLSLNKKDFLPGKTYLYEIIFPENRVVIDYGNRKECVLLAVINTENGDEIWKSVEDEAKRLGLSYAKKFYPKNLNEIIESTKTLSGNEEGYVFHWPNEDNLRIKVKGQEYVRLHKLITEFSTISLWEALKARQSLDEVLDRVPDEFYDWVKEQEEKLIAEYEFLHNRAKKAFIEASTLANRKEQAKFILNKYGDIASLVFSMLDEKDPSNDIWKRIRPKWELPFRKDVNEL